jgi:hypothetical protein
MNRNVWSVWIAMALAGATPAASRHHEPPITVTGCLQNYSTKGTDGTTERGYLLTLIVDDGNAEALRSATPTSGAGVPPSATDSARPRTSRAETSYLLEGPDKDLKEHVGHKVEVTGTVQPSEDEAATIEKTHLHVTSIRRVASSCSQRSK